MQCGVGAIISTVKGAGLAHFKNLLTIGACIELSGYESHQS